MEAVNRSPPFLVELVPAIRQQPQHRAVVLRGDLAEILATLGDRSDAPGVEVVCLVPMTSLEQPCSGQLELGRDVDDVLTHRHQLLGDKAPQSVRSLDRPSPIGPLSGPSEEPPLHVLVCSDLQHSGDTPRWLEHDRSMRSFVRIKSDDDHDLSSLQMP